MLNCQSCKEETKTAKKKETKDVLICISCLKKIKTANRTMKTEQCTRNSNMRSANGNEKKRQARSLSH